MNPNFKKIYENPFALLPEEVSLLELSVKESPYFQAGRVALLGYYFQHNRLEYQKQLKLASISSPDRSVIYQLLFKQNLTDKIEVLDKKVEAAEATIAKAESVFVVEKPIEVTSSPVDFSQEKSVDEIIEESKEQEEEIALPLEKTKITPLERQILEEAISANIIDELAAEKPLETPVATIEKAEPKKEAEKPIEIPEDLSFTQWLEVIRNKGAILTAEKEKPIVEKNDVIEDFIQKFKENEPKIKAPKTEFFSPSNMAKLSIVENEEFVTETLAKIYVQQGNYSKALRAFDKLSLKYPEKSSYFAAQIKEVKQLIKNKSK